MTRMPIFAFAIAGFLLHQLSTKLVASEQLSDLFNTSPLSDALDENGKVLPGVHGSFSSVGCRMLTGAGGAPRFMKTAVPDDNWDYRFFTPGVNDTVFCTAVSGGNLFVGGGFSSAGGSPANHIAMWNGNSWTALGDGVNGTVRAIVVSGGSVYVGGDFTVAGGVPANHIARWDGSSWSSLGSGLNGCVFSLAVDGNNVYAGGGFTTAGGNPANRIAKWNGSAWSALGNGMNDTVRAVAINSSEIYAGGQFTAADGNPVGRIAKWNGTAWSALGHSLNGTVFTIAVNQGNIYAGGAFTQANGSYLVYRIAKLSGNYWVDLAPAALINNGSVRSIAFDNDTVLIGGDFSAAGGNLSGGFVKWDGVSLTRLMTAWYSRVYSIAVVQGGIFCGGLFTTADNAIRANNIAKWTANGWHTLGCGSSNNVYAIAADATKVYVGGQYLNVVWDGVKWTQLGSGNADEIRAIAVSDTAAFFGGSFSSIGSFGSANRIAKWNGTSWGRLGDGLNSAVYALAIIGDNLYVGGSFTTAGGLPANRIAKWDGSSWSPLGSGFNGTVHSLTTDGTALYAGGAFTIADGAPANRIAKWDGSNWSALGSGFNGTVYSLAAGFGVIFAGGSFTTAGSNPANCIAKWNGSSWCALGAGLNSVVYTISASGSFIYVGGQFTYAGGNPANRIAVWDDIACNWSPLGSGLNSTAFASAVSGSRLFVGGQFNLAGGKPSYNFAVWNDALLPVRFHSFSGSWIGKSVRLKWRTSTESDNYGFFVERRTGDEADYTTLEDGFVEGFGSSNSPRNYEFTDADPPSASRLSYRLKQMDRDGSVSYSCELELVRSMPEKFALVSIQPNPVSGSATIRYKTDGASDQRFALFLHDTLGRRVALLRDDVHQAGEHTIAIDAASLLPGRYYLTLTGHGRSAARGFVVLR